MRTFLGQVVFKLVSEAIKLGVVFLDFPEACYLSLGRVVIGILVRV